MDIDANSDEKNIINELKSENDLLKKEIQLLKSDKNSVRVSHQEQADYKESQVRFRTIFETSRLGNKIIAPDLKILQVNPAMVALLGYDRKDEIIGTRILDYAPLECHKDWEILQDKLWSKRIPSFSLETCLRKKDGSIFWCQITTILFNDQGETLGYTIIEDVSKQHEVKQQKENFISIASHELKTPLTSLQASLQLINRVIKKDTVITDRLVKLSENSIQYISKLSALVDDLLNSTKIGKGQLDLNISSFTISELVEKCCSHIRLKGNYHITYKGDLTLKVSADEYKIDQVLVNLVNNAVKYAPESKEILIQTEEIDDKVKILITDQGNGIPKEKIPFLFDSYYQVKDVGNHIQGLGLGLYISAEIIKKHQGEIGVISEVGKGSTFWFTLPL
ncbi:PAS domain-containing sensor histidine kinase [Pedobacter mucosus]|uniref:PAS domain-containing sensor histidine kinase n=1 Tax=Pedobacter mucosus TaxID=2895286 RepID=UPI001EE3D3C9|nr:PAS domain-containing sensor histidine kinase [Pedobacter mucosus]UKT62737.1 PAS domain-containing sensor histidine kinase [Pedobacter mucosus]